jgi:hypothetical protein
MEVNMFRKRFFLLPLVGILVIGILLAIGSVFVTNARMQGYMMGQMAAGSESTGMFMPFGSCGLGIFSIVKSVLCLGGIFLIGGLLLVPMFFMRRCRFSSAWHRMNDKQEKEWGENASKWAKRHPFFGHFHPRRVPPWWYDEESESENKEQPKDDEPR